MVIAVIAVGVVEMAVDEVADVVAVGDGLVAAVRAMGVVRVVALAVVIGGAVIGVFVGDLQAVLVVVAFVGMVEVAVVKVIDVAVVLDGRVTAVGAVLMIVILVFVAGHDETPERGFGVIQRSEQRVGR